MHEGNEIQINLQNFLNIISGSYIQLDICITRRRITSSKQRKRPAASLNNYLFISK
jgi:hypothetical protein